MDILADKSQLKEIIYYLPALIYRPHFNYNDNIKN